MSDLNEPTTIRAGDSINWRTELPAYLPTDGWELAYRLVWLGGHLDLATNNDDTGWSTVIAPVESAEIPAGKARLIGSVSRSGDRITVHDSVVTVLPDVAALTTFDARTQSQRALDDARAALSAYTSDGGATVESYTIAGRSMKFRSAADLITLINRLERDVARERMAGAIQTGGAPGRIVTRSE